MTSASSSTIEKRHCPPEYQARLTRAGGLNRYGTPNFLIVWGQTWTVRRGGMWNDGEGHYYKGYRDEVEDKRPCWVLKQWNAPELYGSPALWFAQNRDEATGLQILGDFPWKGQYETVQPFVWTGLVNGRLVVESMPLNAMIVDMVIPIVMQCKNVQLWRRKLALEEIEARKDRNRLRKVEDARHDAQMAFQGPVSFSRQGCRTSLVDRRMQAISQNWKRAMAMVKANGLGMTIH